jgi:hypothetical protein
LKKNDKNSQAKTSIKQAITRREEVLIYKREEEALAMAQREEEIIAATL